MDSNIGAEGSQTVANVMKHFSLSPTLPKHKPSPTFASKAGACWSCEPYKLYYTTRYLKQIVELPKSQHDKHYQHDKH